MTNKEKYKQAFGVLHAADTISLEKNKTAEKKVFNPASKLLPICICTALIIGMSITAFAYKEKISHIFGWGNNLEITSEVDEDGEVVSYSILHTDDLKEPVIFSDGRMLFVVNGESIDITDQISQSEPFRYEYTDDEGNTHYWFIGLNSDEPENYGYAEYIQDPEGMWIGGYSARVNIEADGSTSAQWLEKVKKELNIPW
ncbi:MAG: hypothetical protein Q4F31_03320 [Eubacteriales bacterium]|nr:hypothetical protein [Eubacteriales bacterium]